MKCSDSLCDDKVQTELPCGHLKTIKCYQSSKAFHHDCIDKCGVTMDCGHPCSGDCGECKGDYRGCGRVCCRPLESRNHRHSSSSSHSSTGQRLEERRPASDTYMESWGRRPRHEVRRSASRHGDSRSPGIVILYREDNRNSHSSQKREEDRQRDSYSHFRDEERHREERDRGYGVLNNNSRREESGGGDLREVLLRKWRGDNLQESERKRRRL